MNELNSSQLRLYRGVHEKGAINLPCRRPVFFPACALALSFIRRDVRTQSHANLDDDVDDYYKKDFAARKLQLERLSFCCERLLQFVYIAEVVRDSKAAQGDM